MGGRKPVERLARAIRVPPHPSQRSPYVSFVQAAVATLRSRVGPPGSQSQRGCTMVSTTSGYLAADLDMIFGGRDLQDATTAMSRIGLGTDRLMSIAGLKLGDS